MNEIGDTRSIESAVLGIDFSGCADTVIVSRVAVVGVVVVERTGIIHVEVL